MKLSRNFHKLLRNPKSLLVLLFVILKLFFSVIFYFQLNAKVSYSGKFDLDVIPKEAGYGAAFSFLLSKFKDVETLPSKSLICGASTKAQEMLKFVCDNIKGVIVSSFLHHST